MNIPDLEGLSLLCKQHLRAAVSQRGFRRAPRELGGVVGFRKVHQHDLAWRVSQGCQKIAGLGVREVSEPPANTLFEMCRVGAGREHFGVVIAFQEKRFASVEETPQPVGNVAEVGDEADARAPRLENERDLVRIMGNFSRANRDVSEPKASAHREGFRAGRRTQTNRLHRGFARGYEAPQTRRIGGSMRRVVAVAMSDDHGGDVSGNVPPELGKSLDQRPVREPRVHHDAGRFGLQEERVARASASQNRYTHEQARAQLRSLGKTLSLQEGVLGGRVRA